MNQNEARAVVVAAITAIAPDADPATVPGDADLFEELDLDSMDLVGIVTRIHESAGIEIPESDYRFLETLDGFVAYVATASESGP